MALRGKKPTTVVKRLKCLLYGAAGVGKTMASIQFPKPYLIDTERGAENSQYVKLLEDQNGVIFQTTDFDEVLSEVKSLLTEQHDYKTLVIDPMTTIYNNLLDRAGDKVGTEFGRHYGEANKQFKKLLNLLLRLDMNIILTSHAKNEYGANLSVLGQTFDTYKKLDYLFDLVIEVQKKGTKRTATIKKTRIASFEEGAVYDFSYEETAKRYGKDVLERDFQPEKLATEDQVAELTRIVDLLKIPKEQTDKWLEKANASEFSEMESSTIQKAIDKLRDKLATASPPTLSLV